eukprot:GHVN01051612.1.p1 GENE.GHVN01051612.1~~GHVN01051612.1.p1  ORF type:complete len:156 (+),score=16.29 GHVN01051612.1:1343-1810(+)
MQVLDSKNVVLVFCPDENGNQKVSSTSAGRGFATASTFFQNLEEESHVMDDEETGLLAPLKPSLLAQPGIGVYCLATGTRIAFIRTPCDDDIVALQYDPHQQEILAAGRNYVHRVQTSSTPLKGCMDVCLEDSGFSTPPQPKRSNLGLVSYTAVK